MTKKPANSFFRQYSDSTRFAIVGFFIICFLGVGYLLSHSNTLDSNISIPPSTIQNTVTPTIKTNTPTLLPTSTIQPTTKPLATKKPMKPTATPITGVEIRFSDVHFYRHPDPMVGFTPFRVANGGNITVPNEKNVSQFELFASYVNYGTLESKNIWVHYFIDGGEVKKGLAYLPGNMVIDNLVTSDSAQPVLIPASGTHTIKIVIDPENQSNDVNQSNNTYIFTYTVQ